MIPHKSYITAVPLPSKADQDGTTFGPNLMTFLYNPDNPSSFCAAVVDYLTKFGTPNPTSPLFTTDGHNSWTTSTIDSTLHAIMVAKLTPAQRVRKTYHSKRVHVACALKDRGSSDGEIQALVRWMSDAALRLYARMNLMEQARKRDNMQFADVNTVNATSRPRTDFTHEELEAMLQQVENIPDVKF